MIVGDAQHQRQGFGPPADGASRPSMPASPGRDRGGPAREAIAACGRMRCSSRLPTDVGRLILSVLGDQFGYWGWDLEAGTLVYSPQIRELIECSGSRAGLRGFLNRIHPLDVGRARSSLEAHMSGDSPFDVEFRLQKGDAFAWVRVRGRSLRDASGRAVFMAGTLEDVTDGHRLDEGLNRYRDELESRVRDRTVKLAEMNACLQAEVAERKGAEQALEISRTLYHSLVENVPYAIFRKDLEGRYTFGNRLYCHLHKTNLAGLVGRTDFDFYPDELARKYRADDRRTVENREVLDLEEDHWLAGDPEGNQVVHTIKCPIVDAEGKVVGVQGMFADVTERRRAAQTLQYQATHDSLTDLPNRSLFQEELGHAAGEGGRDGATFAVFLIDLDRFKEINDTLGHHYGDRVLQAIGPRLRRATRPGDTVARLGGDEFGILLPGADLEASRTVAQRLLEELSHPIVVDGHALDVGASIGIALSPDHGRDPSTLVRKADIAMYAAKRSRGGFAVSSVDPSSYTPRRLALISGLRQAIGRDELRLAFQPKVNLGTGRPIGAEALVRWQHPTEGLMTPSEFLPLAEQIGMIGAMDRWAIAAGLDQCRKWHEQGHSLGVAVNLSATNLQDPTIAEAVVRMLHEARVPASSLIVEVTEHAIMADPQVARKILARLRDEGIAIAVDDFGIGHSSLAYLKELPVDHLKIDQSFIRGMESCDKNLSIVRAVIDLAHNLHLKVTAEGVETQGCLELLFAMGCDHAQGFHLAPPLSSHEFDQWMDRT